MSNKIILDQLSKVELADLSHFDNETNSYFIPKRCDIKIEEDCCYLIEIKESLYLNQVLAINWNNGTFPKDKYLKIDVSKIMPKMIKVVSIGYDPTLNKDLSNFWSGWLTLADISVIQKL